MSLTFTIETAYRAGAPAFTDVLAAADLGEPLELAGAGWTGASWPRGLFGAVQDAATAPASTVVTPELEATFARAGLVGSFLAFVRGAARGVMIARSDVAVTFGVLALSTPDDYRVAVRLAAATARLASASVRVDAATGTSEALGPDDVLARFDAAFAEEDARQVGTWIVSDIAAGRTYHFQGRHGFVAIAPEDLVHVASEGRLARARAILRGDAAPADVVATDARREAVLLTAAMVYAAGADGRLDEEEARQLEALLVTVAALGRYPARELLDAVKTEVCGLGALRELGSEALRKKAFILAGEVIASARAGKLGGEPTDPNVQAISALATALGLDGDQSFIARVVTTLMAKYGAAVVEHDVARSFVLGMLLAAAADGHVDPQEAALLSALARTVPDLRGRDVEALFEEARTRMNGGLDAALADFSALAGHENKCFGLAAEVALVAGRGALGTALPRLREHIRPEAFYAECAIVTFAAKYA